ncbi:WD40 repeat-like protein [Aspergillus ellipticus CBS 707.79]|uniref:Mitochondrial division protein 1 n=1 Tax=Aspergillus ellipticus CBS 707.79 TaxID=1448320 RepID=A0A319D334_9EURO|nr:WD40 repeat-like protein [Aspergillus ellipticus CBS 707.79]
MAQGIDLNELPIAEGAGFEEYASQHEEDCLPGTRTELLHDIKNWAISPKGKCMFWLNGLAGTGKSTISRTVASSFKVQGFLGASFFFKRGEGDRGNAARLFPILTRQLLTRIPELCEAIIQTIRDNPKISVKPLKEQFEMLIRKPFHNLEQSKHHILPLVINDIREGDTAKLRFFVTSRPELPIRLGFQSAKDSHQNLILHEIPEPIIERDISLFLQHRLNAIRRERSLSLDWPGNENVRTLLKMSVPLFIFAATICRLFEDHNLEPEQCLSEILKYKNEEAMDQKLTAYCLSVMRDQLKKNMCSLQSYGTERRDIDSKSINHYSAPELQYSCHHLLHWVEVMSLLGSISEVIEDLSTLESAVQHNKNSPVSEFLQDAKRFVLKNIQAADIAPLQLSASGLIFAPKTSKIRRMFENELSDWIKKGPGGHTEPVESVAFSADGRLMASGAYDNNIILWDHIIDHPTLTLENDLDPVAVFLLSAAGQLLVSASEEDQTFKHATECLESLMAHECDNDTIIHSLEGHLDSIKSIVFSPDGRLLASDSFDKTIKLWNRATGTIKHTLRTDGVVTEIEFSQSLPHLITNLGSFDIQAWHEGFSSDHSEERTEISLQEDRWVAVHGEKGLYLPVDYQPATSVVRDDKLAIGGYNGKLYTMTFFIYLATLIKGVPNRSATYVIWTLAGSFAVVWIDRKAE